LPFHIADGAWNMAADEALLESALAGIASLRLYGWSQPTLSLGYFQSESASRADPRLAGLAWVRRPSGGAALVHHLEATYALALPPGAPWQKRGESWLCRMHTIVADALTALGVKAHVCGQDEEQKRSDLLCFLHSTPGDLLMGGAKIAGSAQRKRHGALLQHGGILLATSPLTPSLPGIRELTRVDVSAESLRAALVEHFARRTGWAIKAADWDGTERCRIAALIAQKYSQPSWNRKR
jgi:lipoate-protein ligase A